MYVDVGLIGVVVNLVDLFNFARECERNKFNYKVGDFRKIDFLGRLLQKQGISKVTFVFTYSFSFVSGTVAEWYFRVVALRWLQIV